MLSEESRERDFPSLAGMIYLNTAAEGVPPRAVGEALTRCAQHLLGRQGEPFYGPAIAIEGLQLGARQR